MSASGETTTEAPPGRAVMDLLGRQLGLFRQLEQLADAQHKAIEVDDTRPLMELLSRRAKLTSALTRLNAELAPYRRCWDDTRKTLVPEDRRTLDEMLEEAGTRLRRILDRDEADGRLLAAKKAGMVQSMDELDTARRTLSAYGDTAAAAGGSSVLHGTEA